MKEKTLNKYSRPSSLFERRARKKQLTGTTQPAVINHAALFAILSQVRYSPRRKIQSLFVLATFVLFDTIRRDRQIVNRPKSDR